MRSRTLVLTTSLLLLVGAACGGSDSDSGGGADEPAATSADGEAAAPDDAPAAGDASTFGGELEDGTMLTVRLDVDESDPVIAPFAAFRAEAGVSDPVVWIVGSIEVPADYDAALGPATGRFLTFVPEGGDRISDSNPTSSFACGQLVDWFGAPTGDDGAALNESYIEVVNDACNGQTLGVIAETGATTDYAMIVEGDALPAFASIYAGLLTELSPLG